MLFNNIKTKDVTPELVVEDETIEVVEELKLLGVQITSVLKWSTNTAYITKRGYNKLWVLRILKRPCKTAPRCESHSVELIFAQ